MFSHLIPASKLFSQTCKLCFLTFFTAIENNHLCFFEHRVSTCFYYRGFHRWTRLRSERAKFTSMIQQPHRVTAKLPLKSDPRPRNRSEYYTHKIFRPDHDPLYAHGLCDLQPNSSLTKSHTQILRITLIIHKPQTSSGVKSRVNIVKSTCSPHQGAIGLHTTKD